VKDVGGLESGPCADKSLIEGGTAARTAVRDRPTTMIVSVRNACGDTTRAGDDELVAEVTDAEGNHVETAIE
jgi:hypothetical protein